MNPRFVLAWALIGGLLWVVLAGPNRADPLPPETLALQALIEALDGQPVERFPLPEILMEGVVPLQERYHNANLRFPGKVYLGPKGPAVINLPVFFVYPDHLQQELWQIEQELTPQDNRWIPRRFRRLNQAMAGYHFQPQREHVYRFSDWTIEHDSITLRIRDGTLVPGWSAGKVGWVAVAGKGEFTFAPPDPIEQQQLNRLAKTKDASLKGQFKEMFLLLSPQGYARLVADLPLQPYDSKKAWQRAKRLFKRMESDYMVDYPALDERWAALPTDPEFFLAEFQTGPHRWLVYSYLPSEREEVRLTKKTDFPRNSILYPPVTWCSFHKARDRQEDLWTREHESKATFDVSRYTIDATLENDYQTINASTTVEIQARGEQLNFCTFSLTKDLTVEQVTASDGEQILFLQYGNRVGVLLPDPLMQGESTHLTLSYRGKIARQPEPSLFAPLHTSGWLPAAPEGNAFHFDLTMRVPKGLTVVAVGKKVAEWEEDDRCISQWTSTDPIRMLGLIFARYRTLRGPSSPIAITVYPKKEMLTSVSREEEILRSAESIIAFYSARFGAYPFPKLDIVQMPDSFGYGQGAPSLLLLWGIYFHKDYIIDRVFSASQSLRVQRFFTGFLAHELAHQWWGDLLPPKSYHDIWLTEGLATYAADLYVRHTEGEKRFQGLLKDHFFHAMRHDKAGAIYLGRRLGEGYQELIYDKSAIVLHMLHNLTGNEDFFKILATFFARYQGQAVASSDFEQTVTQVLGRDMDWFFDQWIRRTGYPVYALQHTIQAVGRGAYRLHCRIEQSQKGEPFRVKLPLQIELKDGTRMVKTLWNKSRIQTVEFILPAPVKKVTLAPDRELYCKVKD